MVGQLSLFLGGKGWAECISLTIYGLWAFLLAFLVGTANSRFEDPRALDVPEANSIGTTYLRAGFLPEPYPGQIRGLLKEYASERLKHVDFNKNDSARICSEEILVELWSQAEDVARVKPNPITISFITTLNETIDLHASRITALEVAKLPFTIYVGIYIVTTLALVMLGFQSRVKGGA